MPDVTTFLTRTTTPDNPNVFSLVAVTALNTEKRGIPAWGIRRQVTVPRRRQRSAT